MMTDMMNITESNVKLFYIFNDLINNECQWNTATFTDADMCEENKRRDTALYILLTYPLAMSDQQILKDFAEDIKEFILNKSIPCYDGIDAKDVAELFNAEFHEIPFPAVDNDIECQNQDFKNIQKLLSRRIDVQTSYEPFAGIGESYFTQSWKYASDRFSYIISSLASLLETGESRCLYGEDNLPFNIGDKKFSSILLNVRMNSGHDTKWFRSQIDNALNALVDNGVLVIIDQPSLLKRDDEYSLSSRQFLVDNNLLEAILFDDIEEMPTYIIAKGKNTDKVICRYSIGGKGSYGDSYYNNEISLDVIKNLDYIFEENRLEGACATTARGTRSYRLSDLLNGCFLNTAIYENHSDCEGRIFELSDFAKDYDYDLASFRRDAKSFKIGKVDKSFNKAIAPVLAINPFLGKVQVCYVNASHEHPAYFKKEFLLYTVNEDIISPDYFYYLQQDGTLQRLADSREEETFSFIANSPFHDRLIDTVVEQIAIPVSKEEQNRQIEDAKLFWKIESDKEFARKKLFEEQAWLTEEHIRNIKHRLRDELTPLVMGLKKLDRRIIKQQPVLADTIVGIQSRQTVQELVDSLINRTGQIKESLNDLTKEPDYGDAKPLDVSILIEDFRSKNVNENYRLTFTSSNGHPKINISDKSFHEIMDYLVENANRHGFENKANTKNQIMIDLSVTDKGECRIVVANNGKPMDKRAEEIYFIRGSHAGATGCSGIGGYQVKVITEHFNGKISIQNNPDDDFPVKFELLFPIINF